MGSPCNTFANEPPGSSVAGFGPQNSQLKTPSLAVCSTYPQFWGSISGPHVYKDQGSQFETRYCTGIEDGCSSSGNPRRNSEFDPRGYVYMVRVGPDAVGQNIDLQVFDPAYIPAGQLCAGPTPGNTSLTNNFNPYVTDGVARYATGTAGNFCVGDEASLASRYGSTANPTDTSFALRAPVDTLNPFQAPPVAGCTKQFPGFSEGDVTRANLKKKSGENAAVNDKMARLFRQWVTLCSFTPSAAGDYYLQVRTNVPLGGVEDSTTGVYLGNPQVTAQTGDNTSVTGNGINNFALRAVSGAPAGAVSVASWEKMRIFANADSATTTFNLVRVLPSAQGKTLVVTFFDVGEGASNGSVKFFPPTDSNLNGTTITNCKATGPTTGTLTGCQITGINSNSYNGKLQTIRVPIPSTYSCTTTSSGGCWWRVQVKFGSGNVRDSTTWTARISGEPVRLIE